MFARQTRSQLLKILDNIEYGGLRLTTPEGETHDFQGPQPGVQAGLEVRDWRAIRMLAARGDIGLTEAYRDGLIDTPDLAAFLIFGLQNEDMLDRYIYGRRLWGAVIQLAYWLDRNTRRGAKRNIAAHYDLGNEFYALWLDRTMTYSSALFQDAGDSLATAQTRKYDRIIDGLTGNSGPLLEIGCGWGGFAERALERGDFAPKGLTLSERQADFARNRLGDGAEIALQDYRDEDQRYDHIVSIEMFEAVGERYWPVYFQKLRELLTEKGRAIIQTITIADRYFARYGEGGDMIRSFIFPGGMLPSPNRFQQEAEAAGLAIQDAFSFGQSYARTLREWLSRFDDARDKVLDLGFDQGFIRVWRFYLAACIAVFTVGRTDVTQYRLAHF